MRKILIAALLFLAALGIGNVFADTWVLRDRGDDYTYWDNKQGLSFPVGERFFEVRIPDLATAGTHYTVIPITGVVTDFWSVIHGAVAPTVTLRMSLGTSGDDTLGSRPANMGLHFNHPAGRLTGTTVTMAEIYIRGAGSAAGDVDHVAVGASNFIRGGSFLAIGSDGGSNSVAGNEVSATVVIRVIR